MEYTGTLIKQQVIRTLAEEFPDSDIYGGKVEQFLNYPGFVVHEISAFRRRDGITLREKRVAFDVMCYLDTTENSRENEYIDLIEKVSVVLNRLQFDGMTIESTEMRVMVINDIGHVYVTYLTFTAPAKDDSGVKMEQLEGTMNANGSIIDI
jgi:hypothetical protein